MPDYLLLKSGGGDTLLLKSGGGDALLLKTSGGGGGSATFVQLERGIRGLNRGLAVFAFFVVLFWPW